MPKPKPKKGMSKSDFMEMCMADDAMMMDHPDDKDRKTACETQWGENKALPELGKETRSFAIEIRKDGDDVKLAGKPIVYGKKSEDMGFIEYVDAGAAKKALKRSDVRALYGHNSDTLLPIGRQSAKTLRLKELDDGVEIEIDPPKRNSFVDALIESIERGDIREMSFGFTVAKDEWTYPKSIKEPVIRHIIEFDQIYDVSYVTFAAYNDTSVALRKMEEGRKNTPPDEGGENMAEDCGMNVLLGEEDEAYKKIMDI